MKKLLSIILAALMVSSMALSIGAAYDYGLRQSFVYDDTFILGDVNGDGAVNSVDSYCLKTSIAGVGEEEIDADASDFNADTRCDSVDSYNLKLCLAGVKSALDYEEGK